MKDFRGPEAGGIVFPGKYLSTPMLIELIVLLL